VTRASGSATDRTGRAVAALTIVAAVAAAGIALWLLPASVHIVDWPRTGPHRVAVLAPLYRLWAIGAAAVVVAAALLLGAGRLPGSPMSHDGLARRLAPLNILWIWTVPYWPWVPDRLPLLVALAGPLRWLFAVLALAGVVSGAFRVGAISSLRPGRRLVFAASLVIYLWFGLRTVAVTGLGGDEPHYLVITHSLLVDGDLRIENNHARQDYRPFFNGDLRPDFLVRGRNGEIYSIHAPGLSALLLPGYAIAGTRGAVATMCLLAALAALAIFEIAGIVAGAGTALVTWALVCLTVPVIPHAWGLFPEMAGTAIVAWAVLWGLQMEQGGVAAWLWRGVCLAWLPWLHTKFSVLLAGLVLFLMWRLRARWRLALALLLPIGLSGLAWLGSFYVIYGSFDPQAPYGSYTAQFVRMENVPRSLLGLLFDPKFGFLVYAPAYALAAPGFWVMVRDTRWRVSAVACMAIAIAFTVGSARLYMWWGGSSAPARFLVPLAPLFAPALALGLSTIKGRLATTTWGLCAGVSLIVGLGGALGASQFLLYSEPHGFSRILVTLQGSAPLAAAVPTFTQPDWIDPAARLVPWAAALALALGAGWVTARLTSASIWIVAAEAGALAVASSLLVSSFTEEVRADTRTRGALGLIERFDPVQARVFDYATGSRLSPADWLRTLVVTFDREPGTEPDALGRLTSALRLPSGTYDARVWFDGGREQAGAFQATVGYGQLLARLEGPLPNPAVLTLSLPIAVPSLWLQLTDLKSARAVRRFEIAARSVEPAGTRARVEVAAVEAIPAGHVMGYMAYLSGAYPEGGVFWTRGTQRADLLLAPAGAGTAVLTIHVGPLPTTVEVRVGDVSRVLELAANETTTLRVALPPGVSSVPLAVRAGTAFRPAQVDPTSTDTRELGCQVRVELE
jgi:hypothetical protein